MGNKEWRVEGRGSGKGDRPLSPPGGRSRNQAGAFTTTKILLLPSGRFHKQNTPFSYRIVSLETSEGFGNLIETPNMFHSIWDLI